MSKTQEKCLKAIALIAKENLGIDTLEVRHSDSLDFYDCGVGGIKAALARAYLEGFEAARAIAIKNG